MIKFRGQKGTSLVELAIAIGVLGIAVAAMLSAVGVGASSSADPMEAKQAFSLAESLMDEISSKAYTKPSGGFTGPYTNANRSLFDSVTDYAGVSFSPLTTLDGGALPSIIQGYGASVSVSATTIGTPAVPAYKITVSVTSTRGKSFSLTGYRVDYEN